MWRLGIFSSYNWNGIDYTGIDVVKSVIEKNRVKYGNDHIHFYEIDAIREELPSADLLICKDVLQHLTNADIFRLLEKFKKYRYCLLTNGLNLECTASNIDIERGSFRDLDLTAAPFNLKAQKVLVFKSHGVNKHTLLVTNW